MSALLSVVLTSCQSEAQGKHLAKKLIEGKLAACVHVMPMGISVYRWQDKVVQESECQLIIKTTHKAFSNLQAWLKENHPYDEPEIIELSIAGGSQSYLEWLKLSVR